MQLCRDTAVTVTTFVFVKDYHDFFFDVTIFVRLFQLFFMVVIGCARKMGYLQKDIYLEVLP